MTGIKKYAPIRAKKRGDHTMNDYQELRYSKMDIREFWSVLLSRKTELIERLKKESAEDVRSELRGEISSLEYIMNQLEKTFDLF